MSADTEHLRITLPERSLAQLDGSAGLTFALRMQHPRIVGSTREYFEYDYAYEPSRMIRRLILCYNSIGCATALPMGVAPEIVLYCLQWRIISKFLTLHILVKEIFDTLPMGV